MTVEPIPNTRGEIPAAFEILSNESNQIAREIE